MERLQQETDENGSDVMITVQDREVSLAQSKLAAEGAPTRSLGSGAQEVKFGTGVSGGDWFGGSGLDRLGRSERRACDAASEDGDT